jgi:hypothetical protein
VLGILLKDQAKPGLAAIELGRAFFSLRGELYGRCGDFLLPTPLKT